MTHLGLQTYGSGLTYFRTFQRATASIVICLFLLVAVTSARAMPPTIAHSQNTQQILELESGKPIEREMAGGASHAYQINLAAGQFLDVLVTQKGIDVVVTVLTPGGEQLLEVDSPNGTEGPETVPIVAEVEGAYRIIVRSPAKAAATGRYVVAVVELRLATSEDRKRLLAEKTYAEAEGLLGKGRAESIAKAIEQFQQALLLWRELNNRQKEAQTLSRMAVSYNRLSDYQKAIEYNQQVLSIRRSIGDRRGEGDSFQSIGSNYAFLGEMREATRFFTQALTIYQALGDRTGEARMLRSLGSVLSTLGETQESLNYLNQALAIFRDRGARQLEAAALREVGAVYTGLGDYQNALEIYNQAKAISREINDRVGEAQAIASTGVVYAFLKEYPKALEYLQQELDRHRSTGDRYAEASLLNFIGTIHQDMGDQQQALTFFQQALTLNRAIGNRRGEAANLTNTGDTYSRLGEHQKGLDLLNQAIPLYRANANPEGETLALFRSAQVNRRMANLEEARAKMEIVIRNVESFRRKKPTAQDLRTSFFARMQKYYEEYIDLLMQMHPTAPKAGYDLLALNINEKTLARGLIELLDEVRADIRQGVDAKLLDRERNLNERITVKLDNLTRLLNARHTEAQKAAAEKEIALLIEESRQAHAEIRKQSPRYAALVEPQPITAQDIQKDLLATDTLLLEYALGDERSYLWAVTPNSITTYQLPPRQQIEAAARRVYDLLTARQGGASAGQERASLAENDARYRAEAAALSNLLLAPVASQLGTKRLLIVAPGALQYLPFAALPEPKTGRQGEGETGRGGETPLMVAHEIVSLPSASVLSVLRRDEKDRQSASNRVAVFADPVFEANDPRIKATAGNRQPLAKSSPAPILPSENLQRALRGVNSSSPIKLSRLPFTRQEAQAILEVTSASANLRALDFKANRTLAIKGELEPYRIIHFATHGILNTERPELSGLVLSLFDEAGQAQDGFLRLHEIYNLRLSADIVILSACQSGLGKEIRGEGLVGLTRGFMYAGAPRVVASLWKVDDYSTAELMSRFYKGMLQKGMRPAAALRAAQLEMFNTRRWQSPYFWAAFVLQGEWK